MPGLTEVVAGRAVQRSVADRRAGYEEDARRAVEATYRLIERTGGLDPSLRDVLAEAGLSTQAFYRLFQSKDELMLVLLDDGRRRLAEYLAYRMEGVERPEDKVRAWIEGVLAQAADPSAAARTRPFLANEDRLVEEFPEEQQASVDLLVGLLADAVALLESDLPHAKGSAASGRRDAEAVYRLTFATLHHHLARRTRPTAAELGHVVDFALRALAPPASSAAARSADPPERSGTPRREGARPAARRRRGSGAGEGR